MNRIVRLPRWLLSTGRGVLRRLMFSRFGEYVLPTTSTWVVNRAALREPQRPPIVSDAAWSHQERHAMLSRSEERLRNIEAKGPGLGAICAVIAAPVVLAVATRWEDSTVGGKALLTTALVYSIFSLLTPIYLVGALARATIDAPQLAEASREVNPEAYLAETAAQCERSNTLRMQRLANLQTAARNDLFAAGALLLVWAVFGPLTGLVMKEQHTTAPARPIVVSPVFVINRPPTTQPAPPRQHPRHGSGRRGHRGRRHTP
jgi:hypothetical protein